MSDLSYMEYKNMPGRFVVVMFCVSTLVLAIHCFLVGFVSLATIRTGEQKKEQAIRTDERNKVLQEIKIENGVFK